MDIALLRKEFPQLQETVYGRPLVYLDNAATSLRPRSVIAKWDEMSSRYSANLHRAVHYTANVATEEFESARAAVAAFIGASDPSEVVFTSGTTQSINLLAFCLGESLVEEGDEILIAECEHHSDIVPWQLLAERKNLKIKVLPVDERGELRIDILPSLLSPRTRLCCVAQVSNVLGIVNPVKEIARFCHDNGTLLLVDGAQGVVHCKTDVKALDCDFYAFSGHKIYAAPGTGVLWGRKALLDKLPPYMGGGEMIGTVKWAGSTYAEIPYRFEAGTQNIAAVPTFKPALQLVQSLDTKEDNERSREVVDFLFDGLQAVDGLHIFGNPRRRGDKIPLFSFAVDGAHHEDLALILDKMGIAVRSGQMCAEPLMDRCGVTGMLRASFAPYNTIDEARYLLESLRKAINMLRG